jgi:hypothetical protein
MKTVFEFNFDPNESTVVVNAYEALAGRVVDLDVLANVRHRKHVAVLEVDDDGDVVVCELDHLGRPQYQDAYAIPQDKITRVKIDTGSHA